MIPAGIARLLDRLFPAEPPLGCGCWAAAHYGCMRCGHTRCEQHRSDPHDCRQEKLDAGPR